jgi:hypothetical protein
MANTFRLIKRISHGKPALDNTHQLYWNEEEKQLYVSANGEWHPVGTPLKKYVIKKTIRKFYNENDPDPDGEIQPIYGPPDMSEVIPPKADFNPYPEGNYNNPRTQEDSSRVIVLYKVPNTNTWTCATLGSSGMQFPPSVGSGMIYTDPPIPVGVNPWYAEIPRSTYNYPNNHIWPLTSGGFASGNRVLHDSSNSLVSGRHYVFYWFKIRDSYYFYPTGLSFPGNNILDDFNYTTIRNTLDASWPGVEWWYQTKLEENNITGEIIHPPEEILKDTWFDLYFKESRFRIRIQNLNRNGERGDNGYERSHSVRFLAGWDDNLPPYRHVILSQDSLYNQVFNNSDNSSSPHAYGTAANAEKFYCVLGSDSSQKFTNLTESGFIYPHNFNQTIESYIYFPEIYKHYKLTIYPYPRILIGTKVDPNYPSAPSYEPLNGEKSFIIILEEFIVKETPSSELEV